jgi:two-component system sensor histidine kinase UhpB
MYKTRILIVEDERLVAEDIERMIQSLGYTPISTVSSGREAVAKAIAEKPDLILLDIVLRDELSGIDAANQIRAHLDIPIIYITAYPDEKIVEAAKSTEPFGYLLKPIDEKELQIAIELALHKHSGEKKLKESDRRYQLLADNVNEGIVIQDENEHITYVNEKFSHMLGYSSGELLGRALEDFLDKAFLAKYKERIIEGKRSKEPYELILNKKDGTQVHANINPEPIHNEKHVYSGTIAVVMDITDRLHFEEELTRSREELRNLSRHLQSVREEESKRIAREIHDEMGQALTALKMDLAWLSRRFIGEKKEQHQLLEKTRSMSELIDQTILLIQKISAELRPGLLDDLGLIPAIEWQVQDFQNRTKIKCKLNLADHDIELTPDQATAIFRVFQESLTNVARHAAATKLEITLTEKEGLLRLVISDNGKGISESQVYAPDALGFLGMRERLRPFKGKLNVFRRPKKGTTVEITLPLKGNGPR